MSEFTIIGRSAGAPASVRWRDGEITGTPPVVARIQDLIERGDEVAVTATGPFLRSGLTPEELAVLTVAWAFDPGYEIEGDPAVMLPVPLPKGAIG